MSLGRLRNQLGSRVILVALLAVLIGGAGGYVIGRSHAGSLRVGMASPAEGAISAEADGWTYNIPLDVPWTDATGSFHDSGRPECLGPSTADVEIKFVSVDVSVEGGGWRQVVWVYCR